MNTHEFKSSDQLMIETKKTRAEIDATLAALEERLSPRQVLSHLVEAFLPARDGTARFTQNLAGAIRENPLPATLTAVGLGWLVLSGRRSERARPVDHSSAYEFGGDERTDRMDPNRPAPDTTADAGTPEQRAARSGNTGNGKTTMRDKVQDVRERARSHARDAADRISKETDAVHRRATDMTHRGGTRARDASATAMDFVRDRPLLTGLAVAGLGAIVATVVLARSDRGREVISRGSNAVKDRMRRASAQADRQANDLSEAASHAASNAKEQFTDAKDRARDGAAQVRETVGSASADVRDAARKKSHDAKAAAEGTMSNAHSHSTTDETRPAFDAGVNARSDESYVDLSNKMPFAAKPEPVTPPKRSAADTGPDARPAAGTGNHSIPSDPKAGSASNKETIPETITKV